MLAMLRADVINFGFGRPKQPVRVEDLLPPEEVERRGPAKQPRLTAKRRQEIADGIRRFFGPQVAVEASK